MLVGQRPLGILVIYSSAISFSVYGVTVTYNYGITGNRLLINICVLQYFCCVVSYVLCLCGREV